MTAERKSMTLHRLRAMRAAVEKIRDADLLRRQALARRKQRRLLLVGDSLGTVLQGHDNTVLVSHDEMAYHTEWVQGGNANAWIVVYVTPRRAVTSISALPGVRWTLFVMLSSSLCQSEWTEGS